MNRLLKMKDTEMERNSAFVIDSLGQAAAMEEVKRELSRQRWEIVASGSILPC
jgi:hypothetical protein